AAIEAVRAELRVLRRGDSALLGGFDLSRVRIDRLGGTGLAEVVDGLLVLGRSHPVIAGLLGGRGGDPWLVSVAASAAYSALVRGLAELEVPHEAAFHGLHAAHVLSAGASG
ncbi:MAG TPA: hypothetical protein PKW35_26100, partial [Nannocystaceae bacterium]|nr:hypothetical protein [Nannocystaceae bacterium]